MKVSVIIPVYNVEKYIDKCLNSLVNQTLKDIEIIVVNDGSIDNSQKIIDNYVKRYPKLVRSFVRENGGQGSARNFGLEQASGEYIAYVDSDDYIEPNMLDLMYEEAISSKSDIVICGSNVVSFEGNLLKEESAVIYNDPKLDIILGKMAVWNKIYKREFLLKSNVKFREHVWYEDIDFTMKLLMSTNKISFINRNLYNYLLRPGSTMNNTNIKRNLELLQAFNEMIYYFKKHNIYESKYDEIEFVAIYHIYITAITRVINIKANIKLKKAIIKEFVKYMKVNFKGFKKNKYIKNLDINKKIIYQIINLRLYLLISIIFKMKEKVSK